MGVLKRDFRRFPVESPILQLRAGQTGADHGDWVAVCFACFGMTRRARHLNIRCSEYASSE
jgi:hypothetical protein